MGQGCVRVEVPCDRLGVCRAACLETGLVHDNSAEPRDPSWPPWWTTWWYDRIYCPAYGERLRQYLVANEIDIIICSGLDVYRYVPLLSEQNPCRVIFDCHNAEFALQRELRHVMPDTPLASDDDVVRVRRAEGAAVRAADDVWVCTERDRELLRAEYELPSTANVHVVPNVVDVETKPPAPEKCSRICFVGRLDYYPNVRAADFLITQVFPLLRGLEGLPPLVVAGASPKPELRELHLPDGVELLADPVDIRGLIRGSIVAVPLTEGGGSRFKVLEAFRDGAVVVSTRKGVEGLRVEAGVHYLRAETATEFAAAIRSLLENDSLRERLASAAWSLVHDQYSTDSLRSELRRLQR